MEISTTLTRALLDSAPDAIVVVDAEGAIVFANAAVEEVLGYSPAELGGCCIDELVPPRYRRAHGSHRATFLAAAQRRPMGSNLDLHALHRDGREIPVEVTLSPIASDRGTLVASTIRDVSAHHDLERRLIEANRSKTRFLAAASHDLRQPVQSLVLLNRAASTPELDAAALRQIITKQRSSLRSITRILDALLDIGKLEAGLVLPEPSTFSLQEIFDEIGAEFEPLAAEKGLTLVIERCANSAHTDPRLLAQMLENLVSNAIKYTRRGTVRLGCIDHGDAVQIEVADTGPGIPHEEISLIFEEFHQVDAERRGSGGLGLGLFIVKRTAELLECPIEVDSEPGLGSTFRIRVSRAEDVEIAAREETPRSWRVRDARILVVDDDLAILDATRMLFDLQGLDTVALPSAGEALEYAEAEPIDLLIVDYHLDGRRTGPALVDSIRASQQRTIPAIVVSGDTADVRTLQLAGVSAVLTKPVDPEKLLELVERLLPPAGGQ